MPSSVVALVPMRHSSERVPGKNYRPFSGRPLYHWIIETLLGCPSVEQVVIDTDSPYIREEAARKFPQVTVLDRPQHLRAGTISMNEVLLDTVRRVPARYYLQTHSTNPLLATHTVERAVQAFFAALPEHDSLFSVTRRCVRLWTPDGTAVNHDPERLLRTQDLPPLMEENSCMYVFSAEVLRDRRNRIGHRPLLFEMDSVEAWDIDDELDFEVGECLLVRRAGPSPIDGVSTGDSP
jgi:CMP-N-acetylneuraminic acid synthetase